ncbi:MAG: hypothetical protein OEM40_06365, partial [Acidimicrobiia bacterium]|nr:hypothetical protein [Acidimicrobiia bacterium]
MTTRLTGLLALAMLLGSCALLPTASTPPEDTTTTSSTIGDTPATPTSTTAPSTEPLTGAIVVTDQAVTILYDDQPPATLTGDVDYALESAFVDLIGGLVFQYADPGPGVSPGILRLLPGTIEPIELITQNDGESLTLIDVALVDGRPNAIYLIRTTGQEVGGQLVAADLQGGAPTVLYDGPDLVYGDTDDSLIVV